MVCSSDAWYVDIRYGSKLSMITLSMMSSYPIFMSSNLLATFEMVRTRTGEGHLQSAMLRFFVAISVMMQASNQRYNGWQKLLGAHLLVMHNSSSDKLLFEHAGLATSPETSRLWLERNASAWHDLVEQVGVFDSTPPLDFIA